MTTDNPRAAMELVKATVEKITDAYISRKGLQKDATPELHKIILFAAIPSHPAGTIMLGDGEESPNNIQYIHIVLNNPTATAKFTELGGWETYAELSTQLRTVHSAAVKLAETFELTEEEEIGRAHV